MSNSFDSFVELPEILQEEAIREGESRLAAQLQVATAADSRALAWGGMLTAAATAALGAGLALLAKNQPDYPLAAISLAFAAALIMASHQALSTVEPSTFGLPGNTPSHWLPSAWDCIGTDTNKIRRARMEQAECLAASIEKNRKAAKGNALKMRRSFRLARWAILCAGIGLLIVFIGRTMPWDGVAVYLHSAD